jgi:hypothetical protein
LGLPAELQARRKALGKLLHVRSTCEDDDLCLPQEAALFCSLQEFHATPARHGQVQEHKVKAPLRQAGEPFRAIAAGLDSGLRILAAQNAFH